MTSEERHELRYQRRKAQRDQRRLDRSRSCGNFEQVFSYEHLYQAGQVCCKGVRWKASTQRYISSLPENTARTHKELMDGKWKTKGFNRFNLIERGKLRKICSVHISERVVQRCLCDNILVPVFSSSFVYDNAASLKGKGIDFAMDRLNCHLQRHWRKHRLNGWALVFDFSDFFNSAPHYPVVMETVRRIEDERIQDLAIQLMEDYGPVGLGLGSQVSQIDALMVLNGLDHFIKEKLQIKGYGRYMDDGYMIHHDYKYLEYCMEQLKEYCYCLGVKLNVKKTKIIPLHKGIVFLKTRFLLTDTGRVVRKANQRSVKKMREKLYKFRKWLDEGRFTYPDVVTAYESWKGHMRRCDTWKVRMSMAETYNKLFYEEVMICSR